MMRTRPRILGPSLVSPVHCGLHAPPQYRLPCRRSQVKNPEIRNLFLPSRASPYGNPAGGAPPRRTPQPGESGFRFGERGAGVCPRLLLKVKALFFGCKQRTLQRRHKVRPVFAGAP